jgi:tetratricopeptide (TPR) repeat protein
VHRAELKPALGQVAEGELDEALETAREVGNRFGAAGIQAKRAEARATMGDLDGALADFDEAARHFELEGARPGLARILRSWGDALLKAGRAADARPILERSIALFTELGLTGEADATRAMLSLGGTKLSFD